MLSGIIFVKNAILSIDLKNWLSKTYLIVNVFSNIKSAPSSMDGIDFIIFDSDPYSDQELRIILDKFNLSSEVKIINITTYPGELKPQMQIRNSRKVILPYNPYTLIEAIEANTYDNLREFYEPFYWYVT
jgi:hypothetical protein